VNKILKLIIFLILFSASLFAGEEPSILHNYTSGEGGTLSLLPDQKGADSIISFFNTNKPDYAVEMLYQFPSTDSILWRDLYFKLRGISRLEEITYFSERKNDYRKMFENAYLIESSRGKKQIPDFTEDTLFDNDSVFAYMEEVVLGKGKYKIDYEVTDKFISITLQNMSKLSRFIKIVDKENFYLKFIFYQEDNHLNVYLFGSYTLENKLIVGKILKYPHSTLAKRVYTIFIKLIEGFHGLDLEEQFPDYLRE
jgi:Family of unknown function (DUF6675)